VEHGHTRALIDAGGQTQKGLAALLADSTIDPAALSAILITHLHGDHINIATLRLAQQCGIPLWMHAQNRLNLPELFALRYREGVVVEAFHAEPFTVGALNVTPFPLAHDALGTTSGFRLCPSDQPQSVLVYAADLGHVPAAVAKYLADAHTLFLESNHDPDLLWKNPSRPYHHKKRVTGAHGHLSNQQCAEALLAAAELSARPPRRIILGHLSADHNSPRLALETVSAVLAAGGINTEVVVALRDEATERCAVGRDETRNC
jgi:phosphoribosyl 1,2-cyclic phosphodiesterase